MGSGRVMKSLWYWLLKIGKGLLSPGGLTAICLFMFCGSMTWFYYTCANVKMDWMEFIQFKDRWRNLILGFAALNILIFFLTGIKTWLQKQLIAVYLSVVVITYVIISGVYWMVIQKPYEFLLAMDAGTLIVTILIAISAVRHDTFEL